MSIKTLKDDLNKNKISQIYLFYGEEEFLIKSYITKIENIFFPQKDEFNKIQIENIKDESYFIDNCESYPLFSEKKLVILKKVNLFKMGKNIKIFNLLSNFPQYTHLIIWEESIDKRTKLFDVLKKNAVVEEFALQKPMDLAKWVIGLFKESKKNIDLRLASKIVDNYDCNMTLIEIEVQKILIFLGEKNTISEVEIDNLINKSIKTKIFDIIDGIAEKNCTKALFVLNDMIKQKEPISKIFSLIVKHFGNLLKVKFMLNSRLSTYEIASNLKVVNFVAEKLIKQCNNFSEKSLKKAYNDCLTYDVDIKSGNIDVLDAVNILIVEYSNKKQ